MITRKLLATRLHLDDRVPMARFPSARGKPPRGRRQGGRAPGDSGRPHSADGSDSLDSAHGGSRPEGSGHGGERKGARGRRGRGRDDARDSAQWAGVLPGLNPVEAALTARRRTLRTLLVRAGAGGERVAHLFALAEELGLPVQQLSPDELERLAPGAHHQGVLLRCGALPLLEERAALALGAWRAAEAPPGEAPPLLVALDQVEDPRNLGAVARAAEAFGASGLLVPRDHSAPLSAVASAASAGALERLPVYEAANLARFLDQAKTHGFWTLGTALEGGEPVTGYTHDRPAVLVLGNEGRGLRPLVARSCDQLLTIPLASRAATSRDTTAGLNVASAAAVLLFQLMTYR